MPAPDTERSRRTPEAPFRADSIGNVTSSSTSSGASPLASLMTVTVGAERSGKMSTGSLAVSTPPATSSTEATASTAQR